ncbi:class I SAM-dependent methyltransferase, partial [candidate division WOR-3 bacterium]|nr:class I SAM-dependent methyltransferase [candidate division WOR-3 bacterium]
MNDPTEILRQISGKRILDVATGLGANIEHLINSLKSYEEIIGIDIEKPERILAPDRESVFKRERIKYVQMDAGHLEFEDNSFDTVSIGNSLHHLEDPVKVLSEMYRV